MDVVQGITLAMESTQPLGNNVFNIGTSKSINLLTLIATINSVLDTSIEPKLIPNPIKENYIKSQQADISKIQSTLGYNQTVNLEEGITQIVTNLNSRTHRSVRDRSHQANQVPVSKVLKS
jgi:UDP-glucose 4-epimerase